LASILLSNSTGAATTRLLATADVRSGRDVIGVSVSASGAVRNPLIATADDDFDVIGAWLGDDGGLDVDTLRGGIGSRAVSASEAARAGLLVGQRRLISG
jgi:hypothetical protein